MLITFLKCIDIFKHLNVQRMNPYTSMIINSWSSFFHSYSSSFIPSSYFYGKPRLYIVYYKYFLIAFLVAQTERICLQYRRAGFDPLLGKIPWRSKPLPSLVFLPGKSHGQRSLAGYSLWGHKESDMTEQLIHTHTLAA